MQELSPLQCETIRNFFRLVGVLVAFGLGGLALLLNAFLSSELLLYEFGSPKGSSKGEWKRLSRPALIVCAALFVPFPMEILQKSDVIPCQKWWPFWLSSFWILGVGLVIIALITYVGLGMGAMTWQKQRKLSSLLWFLGVVLMITGFMAPHVIIPWW